MLALLVVACLLHTWYIACWYMLIPLHVVACLFHRIMLACLHCIMCASLASWSSMIEVEAPLCVFVHFIWHWIAHLAPLAIMHWNACSVARGSRTTHLWSLNMIRGVVASIFLQMYCHTSVCPLLQQNSILQEKMADRLYDVSIG